MDRQLRANPAAQQQARQSLQLCAAAVALIQRCFTDGRFELDSGNVERAMREPAIGRRNFLFTGSPDAAQRLAEEYTLVQSCRALGVSTRDYLVDVLHKLEHDGPARRVAEFVSDRSATERELLVTSPKVAEQLGRREH